MINAISTEKIKKTAAFTEITGTLATDTLQFIYEQKLFKLFLPVELGGRMMELPDAIRLFQEASSIDGSFGWLVTIGSGGNMFVPYMDVAVAQSLFNVPEAVIAGSGHPSGSATKTDGGYLVSGEWKYCSGANFASFFTANSLQDDGTIIGCIFTPGQVEVIEDWDAFGLKGTGSHTIKVDQAFVPEQYTFDMSKPNNDFGGLVQTFPFVQFSQASFAAVCLGICRDFLQNVEVVANNRKMVNTSRHEMVLTRIEEGRRVFDESEQPFYEGLQSLWQQHREGRELEEIDLQQFSDMTLKSVDALIGMTDRLVRHLGMEAIMEGSELNRIWRNLHTAGQHTFLTPQ